MLLPSTQFWRENSKTEPRKGPNGQYSNQTSLFECQASYLVVNDHHIVAFCTQPGVHGLADAAYFVQGRSVVIGPAKVQHLGEKGGVTFTLGLGRSRRYHKRDASATFGLS